MPKTAPPKLKADVYQAVARAIRDEGPGFSRSDVVGRFLDKGVSKSTLFQWIQVATSDRKEPAAAPPRTRGRPRKTPAPVQAVAVPDAPPPSPDDESAMPFLTELQDSLRRLRIMLRMSEGEDGKVRNVRLALNAIDMVGKTLERAARISAAVQDMEAQRKFLKAVADVIYRQPPEVRDAMVAELRALGADGGGVL